MMRLRLYLLIGFVSFLAHYSNAQEKKAPAPTQNEDLLDVLIKGLKLHTHPTPSRKKKIDFSVMPVSTTGVAEGNKVLVSSINIAFTMGGRDSTFLSSIFLLPYTNFYRNIGVGTKQNLWTPNNNWNIPGEFRISSLAQYTYGLGGNTPVSNKVQLDYKNVRIYLTGNRKLVRHFFAGIGFNFDRYYKITESGSSTTPSAFEKYGIGTGPTSLSSGVTFNILHDSRKNSINPNHGFYYTLIYRINPTFMKNLNQWTSLYADVRKYISLPSDKRKILAFWGMYWGAYGSVPYFNLPGTELEFGGRSGRGYAQGRFRGKQMLYAESEYRFDISANKLFGGVLFANAESFTEPTTNRFQTIAPAAGFGARIKFNSKSDTNLTLDFGFGKNSFGFYIGLGEFF